MSILDASGKPMLTAEQQALASKMTQEVKDALNAFGEWGKTAGPDGKPLTLAQLEAIGRGCIVSVFKVLPLGHDATFLQHCTDLLLTEAQQHRHAKEAQERIRVNLADGGPQ